MLNRSGVPGQDDLAKVLPSADRRKQGPVAVIECFQNIPCNPCATACPRGAIKPFGDINDQPTIDHSLCNGCAICVASCPGLAIFVVDEQHKPDKALVKVPFEQYPLPARGDLVDALDRNGEVVCEATVTMVQNPKSFDRTAVVHLEVPQAFAQAVRNLRLKGGERRA